MECANSRRRRLLALGAALVLSLTGCGAGSTPSRSRVQAALVTSGISRGEAQCATGKLFSVLSRSQLRNLAERGSGALDDKTSATLSTALARCVPSAGSSTTVAPSPSATTRPQTAPSTSGP